MRQSVHRPEKDVILLTPLVIAAVLRRKIGLRNPNPVQGTDAPRLLELYFLNEAIASFSSV